MHQPANRRALAAGLVVALLAVAAPPRPAAAQDSVCFRGSVPLNFTQTCQTFKFIQKEDGSGACGAVDELTGLLVGQLGASTVCRASSLATPPPKDIKGTILPVPLPDRRAPQGSPLPDTLPEAVMDGEGGTYAFWYRHALNLLSWSPCPLLNLPDKLPPPAGFVLAGTISLPAGPTFPGKARVPVAMVFRSRPSAARTRSCKAWAGSARSLLGQSTSTAASLCAGQQLVFIFRGAVMGSDWATMFRYTRASTDALAAAYGVGGLHTGFAAAAEAAWPLVKALLDKEVVPLVNDARHPLFVGQSVGGSVATLLALRAQRYLAAECAKSAAWQQLTPSTPTVSALTFAAPNVGGSEFAAAYNAAVNGRNIAYASDILPQIPCEPAQVACPSSVPATPQPDGSGLWGYERAGGQLLISSATMPSEELAAAWSTLDSFMAKDMCDLGMVSGFFVATHLCSYLCRLSAYVGEANNQCALAAPAPAGTSMCGA